MDIGSGDISGPECWSYPLQGQGGADVNQGNLKEAKAQRDGDLEVGDEKSRSTDPEGRTTASCSSLTGGFWAGAVLLSHAIGWPFSVLLDRLTHFSETTERLDACFCLCVNSPNIRFPQAGSLEDRFLCPVLVMMFIHCAGVKQMHIDLEH